jgi:hypothetical protein
MEIDKDAFGCVLIARAIGTRIYIFMYAEHRLPVVESALGGVHFSVWLPMNMCGSEAGDNRCFIGAGSLFWRRASLDQGLSFLLLTKSKII